MIRRSSLFAGIYVLVVFLSGALVGAFAYRLYMVQTVISGPRPRTPEEYRRNYVREMTHRLKLSQEQVTHLQQIMDETRLRYRELHDKERPAMKLIEDEQYQKVREMLNESQRAEYETMRAEREKRRQQRPRK
ncbi:MAG: hypothetical protein M1436_01185 [Acidobacteria bacterium]|nr:hypothetical protein [Acidobacteriota bacterium]